MDYTGTVEKIEGERALVKLVLDEAEEKSIFAENTESAVIGEKVEVRIPDVMTEGISAMAYMVPLSSVILGALTGRFVGHSGLFIDLMGNILGVGLAGVILNGDNLAMAFGLAGLIISIIVLSVWINNKKKKLEEMAKIVRIIAD